MKNVPVALSGLSLVGVAVLFYLHFSKSPATTTASSAVLSGDIKIAYINADTVLKYYDYYKEVRAIFEAKGKKMDQDLQNRAQALQNEIGAYQRNVSTMTIGQAKAVEEDLGKKQQNLQMHQQRVEQELMNDQAKVTNELYTNLTTFLKTYGAEKGFQVVLKFDRSSDVLYGNAGIDISQDVIKGLNAAYQEKKAGTTKVDSTATKK
jgi:outer membrane protein